MCNRLLKTLIERFKNQDMSSFPLIYEVFRRLINFYAARLGGEDVVSELTLCLIELLYKLDLSRFKSDESCDIQRYIAVSLRNRYVALSVKRTVYVKDTLELFDIPETENMVIDEAIMLENFFTKLTEKQKFVLIQKYFYGYSIDEISQMLGISRQATNKIKIKALEILEKCFME